MRQNKSLIHPLHLFVENLLFGYHGWGLVRFVLLTAIGVGLSMVWGAVLERETLSAAAESLKTNLPMFAWLPNAFLILLLTPFHWVSLRFFLVPFFAFILAILLSARYVQDIYNLSSLKVCLQYLMACLFGVGYPTLRIGASEESPKPDDSSYLSELGGPGYLDISSGFVVAVSRPKTPSNIYGEGIHFLLRGEKVEEIADLNDQTDSIEVVSAFSHEGVAIQLSDIHFGYRLKKSPVAEMTPLIQGELRPYTFSVQALRNLMQSRVLTETGLSDWRTMVRGTIQSTIRDFIYHHTVSELIKPPADYNPYADLKKTFQSRAFRERLRGIGTELLWINVGLFDLEKESYKQEILKTWQPSGSSAQAPSSSSTESHPTQTADLDRAQAELIEEILKALEQTPLEQAPLDKIRSIVLSYSKL